MKSVGKIKLKALELFTFHILPINIASSENKVEGFLVAGLCGVKQQVVIFIMLRQNIERS